MCLRRYAEIAESIPPEIAIQTFCRPFIHELPKSALVIVFLELLKLIKILKDR